uniref:KIX domain-containing protein n=1 Tax=Strongyloides papillosus TaxID=174720 RepID=A0A0N5BLP1_STREA
MHINCYQEQSLMENCYQKNDSTIDDESNHFNNFKHQFEEKNHKQNYYYDLAKKMVKIYDQLYKNYFESLEEDKENKEAITYNLKQNITLESREEVLNSIVKIIYPFQCENMENNVSIDLRKYLLKIEKEVFDSAQNKSDYYKKLHQRIFKIQNELRNFSLYYHDFERDIKKNKEENEKYLKYKSIEAIRLPDIKNKRSTTSNDPKIRRKNTLSDVISSKEQHIQKIDQIKLEVHENNDNYIIKQSKKEERSDTDESHKVSSEILLNHPVVKDNIGNRSQQNANEVVNNQNNIEFNINKPAHQHFMNIKNIIFSSIFHTSNHYSVKNKNTKQKNKSKVVDKKSNEKESDVEQKAQKIEDNVNSNLTKSNHKNVINVIMEKTYIEMSTELLNLIYYILEKF